MTLRRPVAALVALVLVVATGAAMLLWQRQSALADTAADRAAARATAISFVTTLLTWTAADLDGARDELDRLMTDAFARTYRSALQGGVAEDVTASDARSSASVERVLLTEVSGGAAHAVVVVDTEVRATTGTRSRDDAYLELALVRRDGAWLVDGLTDVASVRDTVSPAVDGAGS